MWLLNTNMTATNSGTQNEHVTTTDSDKVYKDKRNEGEDKRKTDERMDAGRW